jgi:hypothetical protein
MPGVLSGRSRAPAVQALQQIVGGEFDVLVGPLGGPVLTGDDPHPVQTAEVAVRERVPGLGLAGGAVGERQVPSGVFVPRVRLEEGVLLTGTGLDLSLVAVQHVLAAVNESLRPRHALWIH